MKNRWGVELTGQQLDLDDALAFWGRDGGALRVVRVVDARGATVTALFADIFDRLPAAADVYAHAPTYVDRMNGVLFVSDPHRKPILPYSVLEQASQDTSGPPVFRRHHFLHAEAGGVRLRASATLSVVSSGGTAAPAPPPRERAWLGKSLSDDALDDVLTFLRGEPGWFDLWKAFEMIRKDTWEQSGGQEWKRVTSGWAAAENSARFERSAQFHRHSRAKHPPEPKDGWMSLSDARWFVVGLFAAWMDWRTALCVEPAKLGLGSLGAQQLPQPRPRR